MNQFKESYSQPETGRNIRLSASAYGRKAVREWLGRAV
ncbi:hypothetical protein SPSIL_041040 [Sporomusa silvacetica DSM 10669]|uniref:Uncharacterized protein n=1 Tax=Sporomusa silvacetica DSM 10669 TaxID=1123289 RepID=A0ABZ3IQA4_9FIRM|nr:hypothetical protein SPSIL_04380 [Sporomusa silvacetica DSM 10669]